MNPELVSSPVSSPLPIEDRQGTDSSLYMSQYGEQTDVNAIVSTYMRLNKIFFGVGVYSILAMIVGLILWFIALPKSEDPFPLRDETKILQEQKLWLRIKNKHAHVFEQHEITLPIQQGIAKIEDNKLISINNLLLYKGFVVPQKTQLYLSGSAASLPHIRHFMASGYTLADIDQYVTTFISDNYIVSPQLTPLLSPSHLLKIDYPLTQYLGLSCMQYPGATYNHLCRTLANDMLPKLAVYNLSLYYQELQGLLQKIQSTPYHQQLCTSIQSYIFVANDISQKAKELMHLCGGEFESRFTEFSAFRTTQEQLSKQSVGSNVTTSALLNSYKLVSVMSEIYHEITKTNNINEIRIGGYIDYVRSLLKNKQYIQLFYFDVIARFNNGVLIPSLTQQSLTARGEIASVYRKLLVDLNELNKGNTTQGYQGLQNLVSLQELMATGVALTTPSQENIPTVETLMQQFERGYGFEYLIIDQKSQQDDQTITVSGRLRFVQEVGLANNTPLLVSFVQKDQRFYATQVHMPRHPSLASVLNKKLAVQPLVISELYETIIATYANLDKELPQEVCAVFSGEGMVCTPTTLTVNKGENQYIFIYDAQAGIQSYSVTPHALEQQIKAEYGETVPLTKNPVQAIALILAFEQKKEQLPDTDAGTIGGSQEVQLQRHFDDIGATITTIAPAKHYLMVHFSLQSYSFVSVYDPQSQSILGMGIVVNGVTNPIRNFKFSFLNASQDDKQLLRTDPKTYFLQFDPLLVQKLEL